jgi:Domain of unknown function (DUF4160)
MMSGSVPRISRFFGINIIMWPNDHGVPHFHAQYGGQQASISIAGVQVLRGRLSNRALSLVREWARDHEAELYENWHLIRSGKQAFPIAPLE